MIFDMPRFEMFDTQYLNNECNISGLNDCCRDQIRTLMCSDTTLSIRQCFTATGQIDGTNGPVQTGYVIFPDDRRYNFWYYMEEAVIYWDNDKGKTKNIWRGKKRGKLNNLIRLCPMYNGTWDVLSLFFVSFFMN